MTVWSAPLVAVPSEGLEPHNVGPERKKTEVHCTYCIPVGGTRTVDFHPGTAQVPLPVPTCTRGGKCVTEMSRNLLVVLSSRLDVGVSRAHPSSSSGTFLKTAGAIARVLRPNYALSSASFYPTSSATTPATDAYTNAFMLIGQTGTEPGTIEIRYVENTIDNFSHCYRYQNRTKIR
jgi:hypothetical protein